MTGPQDNAATRSAAFSVTGMNCASCVGHAEKAARSVPGVQVAEVSLARGRASVTYDAAATTPELIAAAITAAGYPAAPEPGGADRAAVESERLRRQAEHTRRWLWRALLGIAL